MSNVTLPVQSGAPRIVQSVRWGENYVSSALNAKFAGIIKPGIYLGFVLLPAGKMSVRVDHGDACRSVAVVERDGYSITVIMCDGGEVTIPTKGNWYICIEAFYTPEQQGYQRIVARQDLKPYHVVIGTVNVTENGVEILADMISMEERQQSEIPSREDLDNIITHIQKLMDNGDGSTLPEKWDSLKKLADALSRVEKIVNGFFTEDSEEGEPPGGLAGLQLSISKIQTAIASLNDRKQQAWILENAVPDGGVLALPVSYFPGSNSLLLTWDGIPLSLGTNFVEQGEAEKLSTTVKLLFSSLIGSEFSVVVLSGPVDIVPPDMVDLLSKAISRATKAAERAENVATNKGDAITVTPLS